MSQPKLSIRRKNPFLIRKMISRSTFKCSANDLARELGPQYQTIDVRIGNQRMILDTVQGGWISDETDETTIDSQNMTILEKRKREFEEDNSIFRAKLDILLKMLAEVTAEDELRQKLNK